MSETGKAVFLSYASQDAEAAKQICDALRQAGVEVWFDAEGGLEHGDEWDAKIRRQIKECVLFIPVISANTQAREEGYFRIEWELAAQRALGIASGVAFILPVVIDDTKEPAALVPDRFRSVQWTRLPGGNVPPDVLQRFLKLWSHRAGMLKPAAAAAPAENVASVAPVARRSVWPWVALGLVAIAVAYLIFKPRRSPEDIARIVADAQQMAAAAQAPKVAPVADFPRDPELRRVRQLLFSLDAIPEDFRLAEDILKPVLAKQPNDPETATVAAEVALEFLVRGFDNSATRRAQAQRLAERAVQLAPDNAFALATLSRYLLFNGAQLARAEELIRKAIALRPDEARFHRALHYILFLTRPAAETDAYGERMAAQFPRDPLVAYDIARRFKDSNDIVQMEQWFDRCLATGNPVAFAMIWKAWLAVWAHGDLEAMKLWIDRVPDRQRSNTRVVNARYLHALFSGDTRQALRALNELTDEWLTDFDLTVPKTLLAGNLAQLEGRSDLARVQFEAALTTVNAELEKTPNDVRPLRAKLWVLIGLGRVEEARGLQRIFLQSLTRPYLTNITRANWANPIISCLLLDFRADALSLLRDSSGEASCRRVLRNLFKLDPRLKPWRDDAEINALLAEPSSPAKAGLSAEALAKTDAKSVAVLAFANLSDDKANEYFSDGISEELLNVLGRVPGLRVAAPMSAFSFKGKNASAQEIGQKLNVAYLVNGSVRRAGTAIRLVARLSRAETDEQIWTEKFDGEAKNVFALQDEIAGKIAAALSLKLGASARVAKPIDPEAFRLYLEGRHFWSLRTFGGFDRAEVALKQAVALEPESALIRAGLAELYATRGWYHSFSGSDPGDSYALASAEVERAVALDPENAQAMVARATIALARRHSAEAARLLQQALALAPNDATALNRLGDLMVQTGRLDAALENYQRGMQLDPLSVFIVRDVVRQLLYAHRFQDVIETVDRFEAGSPRDWRMIVFRAQALVHLGKTAQAAVELRAVLPSITPDELLSSGPTIAELVFSLRTAKCEPESGALAQQLLDRHRPGTYLHALVLAAGGRMEEALPLLRAFPTGAEGRLYWSAIFDPVRDDPRFLRKIEEFGVAAEYKVARETLARMLQEQEAKK